MTEQFDIAIIGAGPGGYSTALRAAQLSATPSPSSNATSHPRWHLLERGCIPTKGTTRRHRHLRRDQAHQHHRHPRAHRTPSTFQRCTNGANNIVSTMTTGLSSLFARRGVTIFAPPQH